MSECAGAQARGSPAGAKRTAAGGLGAKRPQRMSDPARAARAELKKTAPRRARSLNYESEKHRHLLKTHKIYSFLSGACEPGWLNFLSAWTVALGLSSVATAQSLPRCIDNGGNADCVISVVELPPDPLYAPVPRFRAEGQPRVA